MLAKTNRQLANTSKQLATHSKHQQTTSNNQQQLATTLIKTIQCQEPKPVLFNQIDNVWSCEKVNKGTTITKVRLIYRPMCVSYAQTLILVNLIVVNFLGLGVITRTPVVGFGRTLGTRNLPASRTFRNPKGSNNIRNTKHIENTHLRTKNDY